MQRSMCKEFAARVAAHTARAMQRATTQLLASSVANVVVPPAVLPVASAGKRGRAEAGGRRGVPMSESHSPELFVPRGFRV